MKVNQCRRGMCCCWICSVVFCFPVGRLHKTMPNVARFKLNFVPLGATSAVWILFALVASWGGLLAVYLGAISYRFRGMLPSSAPTTDIASPSNVEKLPQKIATFLPARDGIFRTGFSGTSAGR
ncbi:hypothetical protein ZHAS_00020899 [Anopheles sinensis]|uniref:Uncharacterized protein n=1 Tax=Anopheles sinensis TaxID=74873 RepID=A0A084WR02_ANOSI|nr:hypothetical protein ZHAS_00020899 [Anopheles sinensis]